ncbi:MAG TPA: cupin domain-containing protein [Pirellulales bacterium]|jgi:quercetin dioxygenase-like cupin family protein
MERREIVTRRQGCRAIELAPGVAIQILASGSLGARNLTTSLAEFRPQAVLPFHRHPFSEVVVVLEGEASVQVEGRRYRLRPFDAIHLPAGLAHAVRNAAEDRSALLHSSFASDTPSRESALDEWTPTDRDEADAESPERLVRFDTAPIYELVPRAFFRDLFALRLGAIGICGGYGLFEPGASLPCHFHGFDESITIVAGSAICQVAGQTYRVANYDTACVPQGRPHRFLNQSDGPMAMIWVYAGDEPDRMQVELGYCNGHLPLTSLNAT